MNIENIPFTPTSETNSSVMPQLKNGTGSAPLNLASCLLTSSQLNLIQLPKRTVLLDRWLCEADLGYIFAPRGVGKTWLAMALPAAISQCKPLGEWKAG